MVDIRLWRRRHPGRKGFQGTHKREGGGGGGGDRSDSLNFINYDFSKNDPFLLPSYLSHHRSKCS